MRKTLILSSAVLLLYSCAVQKNLTETKITQQQAAGLLKQLAGTQKPERSLYHTYEGTSQKRIWSKKNGSSTDTYKETITLTKQEGNYVEGRVNYDYNGSIGSYPVFGRYNFTHLYLFNTSLTAEWPKISEYRIDQNGRILFETRHADRNTNKRPATSRSGVPVAGLTTFGLAAAASAGSTPAAGSAAIGLNWQDEPKPDVDLYPYDRKYDVSWTFTGFISKTDDYINDEKQPAGAAAQEEAGAHGQSASQASSLADKLRELKSLHEEGLINKEEYEKARKKLLDE